MVDDNNKTTEPPGSPTEPPGFAMRYLVEAVMHDQAKDQIRIAFETLKKYQGFLTPFDYEQLQAFQPMPSQKCIEINDTTDNHGVLLRPIGPFPNGHFIKKTMTYTTCKKQICDDGTYKRPKILAHLFGGEKRTKLEGIIEKEESVSAHVAFPESNMTLVYDKDRTYWMWFSTIHGAIESFLREATGTTYAQNHLTECMKGVRNSAYGWVAKKATKELLQSMSRDENNQK